jgi:polysaccharide biosynthesis protein PslH
MKDLWFFSPILPCPTGHGSAMRAGVALELLAERYRVFLVQTETWGRNQAAMREDWARQFVGDRYVNIQTPITPDAASRVAAWLTRESTPDAVYVFRLVAAQFAEHVLGAAQVQRPSNCTLDLDDNENVKAARLADLREMAGQSAMAERERRELPRLRMMEKVFLSRYNTVLLAGQADCQSYEALYPGKRIVHLPNVVRMPEGEDREQTEGERGLMLFLGTFGYLPNDDGVRHFCGSILPRIRDQVGSSVRLQITGGGASAEIEALAHEPGVTFTGPVPTVGPEYSRCQMLVVPLRAGSGSRIKILEAFSYRRPVVSTTVGAEGLPVVPGEHLLLADTPEEFADACVRLMDDPDLRRKLTENAHRWLVSSHSMEKARQVLQTCFV